MGKTRSNNYELPIRSEYQEQTEIIAWAKLAQNELPGLEMLIGSLNGVRLPIGSAVKAKKAGLKPGYPDLTLLVPKSRGLGQDSSFWHGLLIELKTRKGKLSPDQSYWLEKLNSLGYRAVVCFGAEQAINEITSYLRGDYR